MGVINGVFYLRLSICFYNLREVFKCACILYLYVVVIMFLIFLICMILDIIMFIKGLDIFYIWIKFFNEYLRREKVEGIKWKV